MFKQSRRKIVAAIMSILVLLWVGTLSVIYASSYFEMSKQNEQMLKAHAEMYSLSGSFDGMMPPSRPFPGGNPGSPPDFTESPMFQLSTFYTVAVSYDGQILETKNEPPTVHSDSDLEELAKDIIKSNKTNDVIPDVLFYIGDELFYKNQPKMYSFQCFRSFLCQNEHFEGENSLKIGKIKLLYLP